MLDDLWVCGEDAVDFSGTAEDGGVGRATGEDGGGPVEEAVAVSEKIRKSTENRVYSEAMWRARRFVVGF